MKVVIALAVTVTLAGYAGEARAQQKQSDKEKLELLQEELEGAAIRLDIAKVKARIAQTDLKAAQEILKTTDTRLQLYEKLNARSKTGGVIGDEDMQNLRLTRDKNYLETIQKQGAVELSQLDVRYREWQHRRVENAIKRLKTAKEK
jgi:hypothetical protein